MTHKQVVQPAPYRGPDDPASPTLSHEVGDAVSASQSPRRSRTVAFRIPRSLVVLAPPQNLWPCVNKGARLYFCWIPNITFTNKNGPFRSTIARKLRHDSRVKSGSGDLAFYWL